MTQGLTELEVKSEMSRRDIFGTKIFNYHKVCGLEISEAERIGSVHVFIQPSFSEKLLLRVIF